MVGGVVVVLDGEGGVTVEGFPVPAGGRCAKELKLMMARRGRMTRVLNRMAGLPDPCIVRPVQQGDCKKNVLDAMDEASNCR
jgi:hypothetical protein